MAGDIEVNKIWMSSKFCTKSMIEFSCVSIEISMRFSRKRELVKCTLLFLIDLKPMLP